MLSAMLTISSTSQTASHWLCIVSYCAHGTGCFVSFLLDDFVFPVMLCGGGPAVRVSVGCQPHHSWVLFLTSHSHSQIGISLTALIWDTVFFGKLLAFQEIKFDVFHGT
jgi:hypothetical protein